MTQKVLEEEVKYQSLLSSYKDLSELVERYDTRFNEMPKRTLDFARLQRIKSANEKLYLLVEEKYQEAQINEQSTPGNVLIIDQARVPELPSKPNRMLIIAVGLVLGMGLGFGFAFVRNYFDNTVKTPEELQQRNISLLAWIPEMFISDKQKAPGAEFIVNKKSDSTASEAYRALRTRVRYSGVEGKMPKKILVTSSSAGEGKTTTAVNLAGSFAQANQKVLLLDCDLRKPRVHKIFGEDRYPGFIDYFFDQATFDELIRPTEVGNLSYMTGGTIPPNPAEILGSKKMDDFFEKLESQFDLIIIDSPPIIAVTDSEILSQSVDAVMLVIAASITEYDILEKSLDILKMGKAHFLGAVLNRFSYRPGYGSYYKYYYYYYNAGGNGQEGKKKKTLNV
ncbi:MAG: polysaccharide biosynthesis tyrosine autokinase [Melioribacteraceae bacterium]|nr:polysaccharide biosynthesis tyrosine autokinase [Melioribacteraceae bacterium]